MKQTQTSTHGKHSTHEQEHSQRDIEICAECVDLMRKTAEKCRAWSKELHSAICKGGLSTSAFVCDSIARSMQECMDAMKKH